MAKSVLCIGDLHTVRAKNEKLRVKEIVLIRKRLL